MSWAAPTFSDNSGVPPALTSSYDPGDAFTIETITVTYTAMDGSGNAAICSFNVSITGMSLFDN